MFNLELLRMIWMKLLECSRMPMVFVSMSYSPFVNLSFEDFLFRNHSTTALLLLYRNSTSIIIGRNQNPWLEVNLKHLNKQGIYLVRRQSGGGTVFHDLGNTNYCLMTSRIQFNRKKTLEMVINALALAGKRVYMNERYDLVFGPNALKVSGSAFKISKDRAYQHGTMLLNSNLVSLENCLKSPKVTIHTKGVQSVRSAVGNLELDHEDFCRCLFQVFRDTYGLGYSAPIHYILEEDICLVDDIQKRIQEMKQWSWIYGQTPEFKNCLTNTFDWGHVNVHIVCKHGLFSNIYVENDSNLFFLQELCHGLLGRRYIANEILCFIDTIKVLPKVKNESIQFLEWLAASI